MKKLLLAAALLCMVAPAYADSRCQVQGEAKLGNHECYRNMDGEERHRPAPSPVIPPTATAQCRDNSYSFSAHHSGTCSSHGGVGRWFR
jgi:hypothetical protein